MKKTTLFSLLAMLLLFAGKAWADTYTHTFLTSDIPEGTTDTQFTLSDVEWTLTMDGGKVSVFSNDLGTHFGTNNETCNSVKFTTEGIDGTIASVTVEASRGKNLVGTLAVTVGGTDYSLGDGSTTTALTQTNTAYDFTGNASGEIAIVWTKDASSTTSKGAFYIKKITIEYSNGGVIVAKPVISPNGGNFTEPTTVTLSAEADAIFYTLDGTDPTTASTQYTRPFVVSETCTVKAVAYEVTGNHSSIAEAVFKFAKTYTNIADLCADATSTSTPVIVRFNNWICTGVSAKNASNAYFTDGTNGILLYQSGHGFELGDKLTGTAQVNLTTYNECPELTGLKSTSEGLTVTKGATVTPKEVTIGELQKDMQGNVIKIKGVTYNETDKVFKDVAGADIIPYDLFITLPELNDGATYDVTGVAVWFKNKQKWEIAPRTADEFQLSADVVYVAKPVIEPAGGTFAEAQTVTITADEGCTIYYTTDGTEPSTESTEYSVPFTVSEDCTVKAIAFDDDDNASAIASAEFKFISATAISSIARLCAAAPATGNTEVLVEFNNWIVTGVKGGQVFLTDGRNGIVNYKKDHGFEVGDVLNGSAVVTLTTYQECAEITSLTATTAGVTVTKGEGATPMSVAIADLEKDMQGCLICLEGVTYSEGVFVDDDDNSIAPNNKFVETLPTLAEGEVYNVTGVAVWYVPTGASGYWVIAPRTADEIQQVGGTTFVAAPVIEPAGGEYTKPQTVTITADEGCTIFYTLDQTEPTRASIQYTEPFTVSESCTVKAIAYDVDGNASDVASAEFTIEVSVLPGSGTYTHTFVSTDIPKGTEETNFTLSDVDWVLTKDGGTVSDFSNDLGTHFGTNKETCNSVTLSTNGIPGIISSVTVEASRGKNIVGTMAVTVGGTNYNLNDGAQTTALAPENAAYEFTGGEEGEVAIVWTKTSGQGAFYIKKIIIEYSDGGIVVAKPVITPNGGTFTEPQTVTITAGEGCNIFYTLDGTEPTTRCTQYTEPFIVGQSCTVKAIAYDATGASSNIASAEFKFAETYTSIAALCAAAPAEGEGEADVVVEFNDWIVTGVKGNNVYFTDGRNGVILYQSGHGFELGDKLTGSAAIKLLTYHECAEIKGLTKDTEGVIVEKGATATPMSVAIADLENNMQGCLIYLEGLTYDGSVFVDDDDNSITPYGTFITLPTLREGKTYNATGVAIWFAEKAVWEIAPRTADEFVLVTSQLVPTSAWSVESEVVDVTGTPTATFTTDSDGEVTYESSDESVATIDAEGNITPMGRGITTITAFVAETETYLPDSKSFTLTVTEDGYADAIFVYNDEDIAGQGAPDTGAELTATRNDVITLFANKAYAKVGETHIKIYGSKFEEVGEGEEKQKVLKEPSYIQLTAADGYSIVKVVLTATAENYIKEWTDQFGTAATVEGATATWEGDCNVVNLVNQATAQARIKSIAVTYIDIDIIDAVSVPTSTQNETIIYNLAGQRISKMQKGINIVDGKKVLK